MILDTLPLFDEGDHYRRMTPIEGKNKYRFVTLEDTVLYSVENIIPLGQEILFVDDKDQVWMEIHHYSITVCANYAWNGCSPKIWCGVWLGTPDFQDTIIASLFHDAFCQFSDTDHFPFNRLICDNIFKNILELNDFLLSDIYYMGVRVGSLLPETKYNVKSLTTTQSFTK